MVPLLCTVRSCGLILECRERVCRCANGHSFDRARSGYVNLLQPQDRRSPNPGDSRAAVQARRRLADRGAGSELSDHLSAVLKSFLERAGCSLLDAGCGEGSHLARLVQRHHCEPAGVDLSRAAIDMAARRHPQFTWVVANADRLLPFPDASFDVVLSITSRRNAGEFSRVLKPDGRVLVAVPGALDLIELREAILGEGIARSRVDGVIEELSSAFVLEGRSVSTTKRIVSKEDLSYYLVSTYRGGRRREMERVASLEEMRLTSSFDVLIFSRKGAG